MKTICRSVAGFAASTVLASMALAESATAGTLQFDPNDPLLVTGIEDLEVAGGKLFDVEFVVGTFNDVYGNVGDLTILEGDTPHFWVGTERSPSSLNLLLAELIAAALGTTYYTVGRGDSFRIPWGYWRGLMFSSGDSDPWSDREFMTAYLFNNDVWVDNLDDDIAVYARISVSQDRVETESVPEPGSIVAILALAATGLLATHKDKK